MQKKETLETQGSPCSCSSLRHSFRLLGCPNYQPHRPDPRRGITHKPQRTRFPGEQTVCDGLQPESEVRILGNEKDTFQYQLSVRSRHCVRIDCRWWRLRRQKVSVRFKTHTGNETSRVSWSICTLSGEFISLD